MTAPPFLWVYVVYAVATISLVVLAGVAAGLKRAGYARAEARSSLGWAVLLLVAWIALAAALGVSGAFSDLFEIPGVRVGVGLGVALLFSVLVFRLPRGARLLHAVPQSWLIGVQAYRGLGSIFLVLYGLGQMPGAFALPAGFGDVAIALCAIPLALLYEARFAQRDGLVVLWNVAGILDLVVAATMGVHTAPALNALGGGTPNVLLAEWPLILVPLFAVPLSIVLHVASLTKLGWDRELEARRAGRSPTRQMNARSRCNVARETVFARHRAGFADR